MQVKIYFTEEGHIKIVDTTAIPSSGMVTEGRGWSGPTAAMASIDELDACDPYGRGVEIIRSAIRWNGDIVHASRVTLVPPRRRAT